MKIHILYQDKLLCGRSKTVGGYVSYDLSKAASCPDCLRVYQQRQNVLTRQQDGSGAGMTTTTPVDDWMLNPLNPLSPLSPISPFSHPETSEPAKVDPPQPSFDPPGHDSGGGYDGGGGFDGGGGGGE